MLRARPIGTAANSAWGGVGSEEGWLRSQEVLCAFAGGVVAFTRSALYIPNWHGRKQSTGWGGGWGGVVAFTGTYVQLRPP